MRQRSDQRPDPHGASRPVREQCVDDLVAEYYRPLLSFSTRLTGGDRQWAEDVVQETLLRAWRNIDGMDRGSGSLMPWLGTVARRLVIDEHRRRRAKPQEVGEGPLHEQPSEDGLDVLLRSLTVEEAMTSLSAAHRQVLTETFLRDRTVNQAAEVLDLPVGTVKSRTYYALRALRVALEERGVTVP